MRGDQDQRLGGHSIVDPDTGEVEQLPTFYQLPVPLNPADPFDEVQLQGSTTSSLTRHKLWFSRKLGQVTRWEVDGGPGGRPSSEVMVRVSNGAGITGGEFIIEDHYQASPDRFLHNPTHSGGFFQFQYGLTIPTALQRAMHPPIPLHLKHRADGTDILCEGGTIPLEFGADGFEQGGAQDHGGGRDTAVGYPRFRSFLRVHLVDDVCHLMRWTHSPVSWDAFGRHRLRDVNFQCGFSTQWWPIFRTAAEFFDPVSQVSYRGMGAGGGLSTAWAATVTNQILRGRRRTLEMYGDAVLGAPQVWTDDDGNPRPLQGELLGGIISTTTGFAGDALAIGILARLRDLEDDRGGHITQIDLQSVQPTFVAATDNAIFQALLAQVGSNDGRPRGWVGQEYWVIIKPSVAAVRAEMVKLARDRVPLREVPFLVPAHMQRGTWLGNLNG